MFSEVQIVKYVVGLIGNDKALAAVTVLACLACAALWRVLQKQTNKFQDRLIHQIEQQHRMQARQAQQKQNKELIDAIKSAAKSISELDETIRNVDRRV